MSDFWVTEAMNGFGMTVQVEAELCRRQSKFQKIELYQTAKLGRLLIRRRNSAVCCCLTASFS